MAKITLLIVCGAGAGFINGMLGTGGGILLIFALNKLLKNIEGKDIYALTLTVTLGFSLISSAIYFKNGSIAFADCVKYVVPAIIGGIIGAYLLDRLEGKTVKKIFGVLVITAGANMAGFFG